MTWHDLLRTRRVQRHRTTKQELDGLRTVVEREDWIATNHLHLT